MTSYRNSWYKYGKPEYGPPEFSTSAIPTVYGDYLVYEREPGRVWDVVLNGVCVTQRAGPNGARRFCEEGYARPQTWED